MNMFLKTVALGAALTFLPGLASAGQRYAPTPALTLNADVSSPWILQIRPKHLRSARRTKRNAKRQYLFKREQSDLVVLELASPEFEAPVGLELQLRMPEWL